MKTVGFAYTDLDGAYVEDEMELAEHPWENEPWIVLATGKPVKGISVLVVSRTRMAGGCVCVGGVDLDNLRSVRLAHGVKADVCPLQIGEVYECEYDFSSNREAPHRNEDASMYWCKRTRIENNLDTFLRGVLQKSGGQIPYVQGNLLQNAFDGCLKTEDGGGSTAFIEHNNIPSHSTCFWVADKDLYCNDVYGKKRLVYGDGVHKWGLSIPWVGCIDAPNKIQAGTLVRLSLAHWWRPNEPIATKPLRCYLQLSGVY